MTLINFPLNNKAKIKHNQNREKKNVSILALLIILTFICLSCYTFWAELQITRQELDQCKIEIRK